MTSNDEGVGPNTTISTALRQHVEIYEEHLRMLTTENARLMAHLQQLAGITGLGTRRAQQQLGTPGIDVSRKYGERDPDLPVVAPDDEDQSSSS